MPEAEASKIQKLSEFIRWHLMEVNDSMFMREYRNASFVVFEIAKLMIDEDISNLEIVPEEMFSDSEHSRDDIIDYLEEILEELVDTSEYLFFSYEKYRSMFAESGKKINLLKDILEGNPKDVNQKVWDKEITDLQQMREKMKELCIVIPDLAGEVGNVHPKYCQAVEYFKFKLIFNNIS